MWIAKQKQVASHKQLSAIAEKETAEQSAPCKIKK